MISPIELTGNPTVQDVLAAVNGVIAQINNHGITADNLAANAVTNGTLASDSVDENIIQESAVGSPHIQDASIETAHIQDAAIGNAQIDRASINKLVITNADIDDANINKLSAGEIDADHIVVKNIDASQITTNKINGNQVELFTITYENIAQTTGNLVYMVGAGMQFASPQEAVDSLPLFINHDICINVYAGTYGALVVQGFMGNGNLSIISHNYSEVINVLSVDISNCQCSITIGGFTVPATQRDAVKVTNSNYVQISFLTIHGIDHNHNGIDIQNSIANIMFCEMYNTYSAISAFSFSDVSINNLSRTGNTFAYAVELSTIRECYNITITSGEKLIAEGGSIIPVQGVMTLGNTGLLVSGVPGVVADDLASWDANGNAIDSGKKTTDFAPAANISESAIASTSETGNATKLVTGTAGASGNLVSWDANGNAVDSGKKPTDFAPISGSTSYAPISGSSNYAPMSGSTNYAPISGSANYAPSTNIAESAIAAASETGNGTQLVTGSAGTSGNLVSWDANGNAVDSGKKPADFAPASGIAETAIASASETGNGTKLVTGTAGTSGNFASWDANGNAVDSGKKQADFAPASGSANYAPASGSSNYAPSSGIAESAIASGSETGTGSLLATALAAGTSGNLASWDANGNIADSGLNYPLTRSNCAMVGTDTNGAWKFDNGTLICFQRLTISSIAVTSAWGSLYTSGSDYASAGNFAYAFAAVPTQTSSYVGSGSANTAWLVSTTTPTTTAWGSFQIARATTATLTNAYIDMIAVGRWK